MASKEGSERQRAHSIPNVNAWLAALKASAPARLSVRQSSHTRWLGVGTTVS